MVKQTPGGIGYIVTHGQDQAEALSYAKLPAPLQQQDQTLLSGGSAQAMNTSK